MGDTRTGGEPPPDVTLEQIDDSARFLSAQLDGLQSAVEAGTGTVVGTLDDALAAVDEMRDRGVEARALPEDAGRRLAYRDAVMAVATASVAAIHGRDSAEYRAAESLAWEDVLGRSDGRGLAP